MNFKQLEWEVNREGNAWFADSPSTQTKLLSIYLEEDGFYYPIWDCNPSFETLEDAKEAAQAYHETFLLQFFE